MTTPKYQAVAGDLRSRLAAGEWPVGAYLPSIGDLMIMYSVPSLNTIRGAQAILANEGLISAEPGRGVRVVAHPAPSTVGCNHQTVLDALAEARRLLSEAERALANS